MIGLKCGTVALYEHEKEWETEAQNTIERLKNILGDIIQDIQHVGSTSIQSIKAKPIIDIAVAVDDFNDVLKFENELRDKDTDIKSQEDIRGVISENIFLQVLNAIQQVCCIDDKDENVEEKKFKNSLAKKLYEKMLKAEKAKKEEKKFDVNFTLPNIISSVSNRHPTVSPINVWELTIFQLYDSFNRMQVNSMFDIDSTRVSVWGDEKKTFDAALWYKNEYDKK